MDVLLLADTHVRDGAVDRLDPRVLEAADASDLVLHAGDVTGASLLERLGRRTPVRAVLGNNDVGLEGLLPERSVVEIDGLRVAMVHDRGPRAGRVEQLQLVHLDAPPGARR